MRTPRLPVVDWTDAPTDLNGLARFSERRNLVSARVPSHFNCTLLEKWTVRVLADHDSCVVMYLRNMQLSEYELQLETVRDGKLFVNPQHLPV